MVVVGGRHSREHQGADAPVRDRGHARRSRSRTPRTSTDPAPFDGAAVVGVTGGTSTPIEDLRDVAERIIALAGTPDDAGPRTRARASGPRTQPRPRPVAPPRCRDAAHRSPRRRGLTVASRSRRRCRSSPSSGARTSASARSSTASSARRAAIVEDRARTTRDRLYGDAEWNGRRFVVVDTGGLETLPGDPIEEQVQDQARLAISEADVIVFVVDAATGLTPADQEPPSSCARRPSARARGRQQGRQPAARARRRRVLRASAGTRRSRSPRSHGRGVADLLDAIVWALPPETEAEIARKTREAEAEAWATEMAARAARRRSWWRRRPTTTTTATDDDDPEAGSVEDDRRPLGRGDGRRGRRAAPRSRSSAGRTSASRACSTRCSARTRTIVSDIAGHDARRDRHDDPVGPERGRADRHGGIRRRGKVASGPAADRYSTLRALKAISPRRRRGPRDRRGRRADGAGRARRRLRDRGGQGPRSSPSTSGTSSRTRPTRRSTQYVELDPPRARRSSTSRRSSRSAPRPASACRRCSSWRSTSGASAAAGSRPASSTGSSRRPSSGRRRAVVQGKRPKILLRDAGGASRRRRSCSSRPTPSSVHFSYRRYLENRLREAFGFTGTPIRLVFREQVREKRPKKGRGGSKRG